MIGDNSGSDFDISTIWRDREDIGSDHANRIGMNPYRRIFDELLIVACRFLAKSFADCVSIL